MESQQISNRPKRFTSQSFDKFKELTTTDFVYPAKFSKQYYCHWYNVGSGGYNDYKGWELSLIPRHVKTPEAEVSLIDYEYLGNDWFFIRDHNMIINIDEVENITLKAIGSYTEVGYGSHNAVLERGYYPITKQQLKKICDAKFVEVRVSGSSIYHLITNEPGQNHVENSILPADKFLFMCRAFYSEVYEDDSYSTWLNTIVPVDSENDKSYSTYVFFIFIIVAAIFIYFVMHKDAPASQQIPINSNTLTGKVKASSGLNIRSEANSTAPLLLAVPYNQTVSIVDTNGPSETIAGHTANWIKVEYNGTTGWAWSGFVELP